MKYLFLIVSLLIFFSLHAQDLTSAEKQQNLDLVVKGTNSGVVSTYDNRYEGFRGTPYFYDDWWQGQVELEGGTTYENIPLKYDVYNNELLTRIDEGKMVVLDRKKIESFVLGEPRLTNLAWFKKAKDLPNLGGDLAADQFVQVVYEGESKLLAVHKKLVKEADFEGGYSANRPYDEFQEVPPDLYFISEAGAVYSVKPKKRAIVKLFASRAEKIKAFMEEENINPGNLADLAQTVEYYDQIYPE